MVYDENSNPVGNAEISVAGVNHDVTTGEEGGLELLGGGSQFIVTHMWLLFAGRFFLCL